MLANSGVFNIQPYNVSFFVFGYFSAEYQSLTLLSPLMSLPVKHCDELRHTVQMIRGLGGAQVMFFLQAAVTEPRMKASLPVTRRALPIVSVRVHAPVRISGGLLLDH